MNPLPFSSSARTKVLVTLLSVLSLALPGLVPAAHALDPTQMPGYQCYSYSNGKCTSYSYLDYTQPANPFPTSTPYTYPYSNPIGASPLCNSVFSNCVNGISVRGTGSPNPANIGDYITYSVYVRNDSYTPNTASVQAFLDPATSFASASRTPSTTPYGYAGNSNYYYRGNPYYAGSNNEVDWSIPLAANSGVRFTFRALVQSSARDGQSVQLRLQANGSTDQVTSTVRSPYSNYGYNGYNYGYNGYSGYNSYNRYTYPYSNYNYYGYNNNGYNYGCTNGYGNSYYGGSSFCNGYNGSYNNGYCGAGYGNCGITMQVNDSSDPIAIGQIETYSIYLRNNDSVTHSVSVQGYLDPGVDFYSASDGGTTSASNSIQWNNVVISPNSSVTLQVSGRVNGYRGPGSTLTFTAQTNGGVQQSQTTTVSY